VTLPAFAAERRSASPMLLSAPAAVDISCLQGAQQQTRRPRLLPNIDGTHGQTDA